MQVAGTPPRITAWNRFYWIATIWLIGWLGIITKQAVSHGSPVEGIKMGAFVGAIVSPFLLILTLPLGLLGWKLATWKPLRRNRLAISLLLPVLFSFMGAAGTAWDRVYPQKRFKSFLGVNFPAGTKMEQCWYEGTLLFADKRFTFEFECSPEETARLIQELKLSNTGASSTKFTGAVKGGWLVEEIWSGISLDDGRKGKIGHADYVELHTDSTRTHVYIVAGTI